MARILSAGRKWPDGVSCTGEAPFIQANNARTFVFDLATEKLIFGEA